MSSAACSVTWLRQDHAAQHHGWIRGAHRRQKITLDGAVIGPPHWSRTMVFQDYALFPTLTIERNIAFGLEVKGVPEAERARIVASTSNWWPERL